MKIAFCSTTLPEAGRKPGGVDVNLDRLANRLSQRHELTVFSFSPRPGESVYHHVRLKPDQIRYSPAARLTLVPMLLNRLRFDVDIVHLHGDDHFLVRRSRPMVRTFYGSALEELRSATRWRRRIHCAAAYGAELLSARLATASYSITPSAGSEFRVRGVLPPGVDVSPRALKERSENPTILFIGTWGGRKRGQLLMRAFESTVRPQIPSAELVMVSDFAEPGPRVRLVTAPSDSELDRLLRRAWVFCLPSSYEGFGIPYAEAMAAGVPVVATDNVGARYVLDGGGAGLLVSDDLLGETIVNLIRDDTLATEYSRRGLRRAEYFAWERVLRLHEEAYEDAIDLWRDECVRPARRPYPIP